MDDPQSHLRESVPPRLGARDVSLSELLPQALVRFGQMLVLADKETGALPGFESSNHFWDRGHGLSMAPFNWPLNMH